MNFFKDLFNKKKIIEKVISQPIIAAGAGGYLQGQILLATPLVQDPYFSHTAIFICSHDDFGAMGIVINKAIKTPTADEVLESLKVKSGRKTDFTIGFGGPVETTRGFVLHSDDYATKGTVTFESGIAISSDRQVLDDYIAGKGPKNIMLAMGYTGWVRGQVENEINLGAWITVPADPNLIFKESIDSRWQKAATNEGIDINRVAPFIGRA